jgi:hypothetical protein
MSSSIPKEFTTNKTLHIFLAATTKNAAGQGICYNLCLYALKKAKENGYKYAIAELTAPGTQHIFINKLGFTILREFDYNSYGKEFITLNGKCILAGIHLEEITF